MDVEQILSNARSTDNAIRQQATAQLQQAEQTSLAVFMHTLSQALANEGSHPLNRQLAALQLKNAVDAKDIRTQREKASRWMHIPPDQRNAIKALLVQALQSPEQIASHGAARVVAKIGVIEIEANEWLELIDGLLENMKSGSLTVKEPTLQTLGYLCEDIEREAIESQSNKILTAIVNGMTGDLPDRVKLAATQALLNALEFVGSNFERDQERDYIMRVICESAASPNEATRQTAFECLVRVAANYYEHLLPYMKAIYDLTVNAIKTDTDDVGQQAVEFWSTVCDEEIDLNDMIEEAQPGDEPIVCHNFIKNALQFLAPVMTETLCKNLDSDEDEWNVSKAAGTCLKLIATTVRDDVVDAVMPFVHKYINDGDSKLRDAATLAFGSILEGPEGEAIGQLIQSAIPVLVEHLRDPSSRVRDTTAWTIGRIAQWHQEAIAQPAILQGVVQALVQSLQDKPRCAASACWALHNIFAIFDDMDAKPTSPMSGFFSQVLGALMQTSARPDAQEESLCMSAYECINALLDSAAADCHPAITASIPMFLERLEQTFTTSMDKEEANQLQAHICSVLNTITQKKGPQIMDFADQMMQMYLRVLQSKKNTVHEECLMAISALAQAVHERFATYMPLFHQFLINGLKDCEETGVCIAAIGVVGDCCRALGPGIWSFCDNIILTLLNNLQNQKLDKSVKPDILGTFGDIAMAIGGNFEKYLAVVKDVLQVASTARVDMDDPDMVEYLNRLRESIFNAYTGIFEGLRADNKAQLMAPYLEHLMQFMEAVWNDNSRSRDVVCAMCGCVGDMALALRHTAKPFVTRPFVDAMLKHARGQRKGNTKEIASWALDHINSLNG